MARLCEGGDQQGVAIGIGVVAEHARRDDGQCGALRHRVTIGNRIRHVIDVPDVDADRRGIAATLAIADRVAEAVGRRLTAVMRVGETAVGIQCQRAVHGLGKTCDRERIAVQVRIVGQHTGRNDGERAAFGDVIAVVDRIRGIVYRRDVDRHGGGVGAAVAVADGVGEARRAVEVQRGRELDIAAHQGHRAVGRTLHGEDGENVAIRVRVVGQQRRRQDGERSVLGRAEGIIDRIRHVVHRGYINADSRGVGRLTVTDRVGEACRAIEIRRWCEYHVAIDQCDGTVRGILHGDDEQGIAVGIGIVTKQCRGRDGECGILGRGEGIVHGVRCVVFTCDPDAHGHDVAVEAAVVGLVSEAVGGGLAPVVHVAEAAVWVQRQRAVRGSADQDGAEAGAVHVAVVGQHAQVGDDGECAAFGDVVAVGNGHRRIVHRRHADRDTRRGGAAMTIGNGVGEACRAVEVRRWGEHHIAIDQGHRSIHGILNGNDGERVAVHIAVVGEQRGGGDGEGGVLGRGEQIAQGYGTVIVADRRVVHRRDGDEYRGRIRAAFAVGDGVVELSRTVIVGIGREQDLAVHQGHRAVLGIADGGDAERIAVHVAVVGEQQGGRNGERGILCGRQHIVGGQRAIVATDRRVVHRRDGDEYRGRGRAIMPVGDGVVELPRTVIVGIGCEHDLAVHQRDRTVLGIADGGDAEHIAVHIAVVGEQHRRRDIERCVLGGGQRVVGGLRAVVATHWWIIHRRDVDCHSGRGGATLAIGNGVGEGRRAVEVGIGREEDLAVHQLDAAIDRALYRDDGERVAVHVAVVGEQHDGINVERGVFGRGEQVTKRSRAVVAGIGRIIHRRDGDIHRGRGGATPAIRNGVGEARLAVEVRIGCKDDFAVDERDRSMHGVLYGDDGKCITIGVHVVGKQCCGCNDERGVFRRGQCIVARAGAVVIRSRGRRVGFSTRFFIRVPEGERQSACVKTALGRDALTGEGNLHGAVTFVTAAGTRRGTTGRGRLGDVGRILAGKDGLLDRLGGGLGPGQ